MITELDKKPITKGYKPMGSIAIKIGSDRYLIDGDCVFNRKSLAVEISKAFTFFKNKAGIEKKFSLKHLRKTFLTKMETKTSLVKLAGYQKNASVIEKNYLDKIIVSKRI